MGVLRKIRNCFRRKLSSRDKSERFYVFPPSCQIPKLDVIYEQYFGKRTDGCFVEVGAFDGEYSSNTCGLADLGWTGYYIEPVPQYYERCKARHAQNQNVTVNQLAIGAEPAKVEVNVGGPLTTIRNDVKRNFESLDWARGHFVGEKVQVDQITLEEYLVSNNVKTDFELLSVDVEGYEWNVLRNFNIKQWRPQMVVIELHDQNDDYILIREDCNKIVRYFDENDYKVIFKDFTNTIYVPKRSYPRT